MTKMEEKILYAIQDMRECEDWEIEQFQWADSWSDESPSIREVALYIMEKRITEESDFLDTNVPDIYFDELEVKIKSLMQEIINEIALPIVDDYDPNSNDRLASALGDYADTFIVPGRFTVKTFHEAKEIITTIEYLQDRYGTDTLSTAKNTSKSMHLHGKQRARNTPKVSELKEGIKELCTKRIAIIDKQRKEKIINKIINIVTA